MDKRGRVVISVVVLFFLLVSISSYFVLATETNTKSYDTTTNTVTLFYQNNPLGTVTLLDNSYYCNSYCYAILKVNTSISKQILNVDSSVIGNVNFLKKVGVSWLPDSLNHNILVGKKQILTREIMGNSTSYNTSQEIIDWIPLKDAQISNGQEFYIKIEGYKDSKKDVDWILNLFGLDLDEFAQWNYLSNLSDDFSDSFLNLTLWNNETSSSHSTIEFPYQLNLSLLSPTAFTGNNYIIFKYDFNTSTSWKIQFNWSYSYSTTGEAYMAMCNVNTGLSWSGMAGGAQCKIADGTGGFGLYYTNIQNLAKSQYYIIINSTNRNVTLYNWDGTTNHTETYTDSHMYFVVGVHDGAYGMGTFINMSLMNFNVYQLGEQQDTIAPTITLNSPENYANLSTNSVAFNCTAQDDNIIQNISLWINGEVNYTLTDGVNNYTELYIERTLGDGIYNWACSAYDNAIATPQIGWGINRTLMIDTTPPQTSQPTITPPNPIASNNLQCSATLTDDLQTSLTAYWRWYKNGIDYLSGTTYNISNGATNSLITTLSAGNLTEGDNWTCEVKPFNGYRNGTALNSSIAEIKWGITFNVTSTEDGNQLGFFNINCNNSFSVSGVSSPYTSGFSTGSYQCTFSKANYFDKLVTFVADNDKIINVSLSLSNFLSHEEHTWLEAIYNCLFSGDCSLYNQLLQVNQTLNNVSQTVNNNYVLTQALNDCVINGNCVLYNTLLNVNQTVSSSATLTQALNNCIMNGDCTLYNTLMNINQTVNNNYVLTQATYQCINFGNCTLYNTIMNINNNTINSLQEHTWLQAIYDCTNTGSCTLYNNLYATLMQINQTLVNVWQNIMPTNQSVVIYENITNRIINASLNLTINYSINIPIKAGYALGAYLPVRIGFWFLNASNNLTCFNQGDKPTGVIGPYCQPLITEVIGPMGGQVNFTVKLHPNLPVGNYSFKRTIDIDPNGVWTNYGQDIIGIVEVKENNPDVNTDTNNQQQSGSPASSSGSSITNVYNIYNVTNIFQENKTKDNEEKNINKFGITGGVIGMISSLLSGGQITFIITIICITFILFILIKSSIIKIKR